MSPHLRAAVPLIVIVFAMAILELLISVYCLLAVPEMEAAVPMKDRGPVTVLVKVEGQEPRTLPSAPVFDMSQIKDSIEEAVKHCADLPLEERRSKIRALRLKWHPDKHEVLKDVAEEVTKVINEAVARYCAE